MEDWPELRLRFRCNHLRGGFRVPHWPFLNCFSTARRARGVSGAAIADARETLAMVGDSAWEGRLAKSLSTGQQRLVALARALVGPPPLVVVDEPASGMGAEEREGIARALIWARDRGCAVLCATSDPGFAEMLVDVGGRRVDVEAGRIAGAPAIGLVPNPVHLVEQGEAKSGDAAEVIRLSDRRSSGEESS